ncbi:MAG: hypothetical protein R3B97_04865 [Dehalococcoidia bacterium]|nr:hypothetical protein [Dehalococcoidia bacterium]MCB9486516.1 hypothetical protein [Thermoflexaceae bacterium]
MGISVIASVVAIGATAAILTTAIPALGGDEPTVRFAEARPDGAPDPLSPEQCRQAEAALLSTRANLSTAMDRALDPVAAANAKSSLNQEVDRSLAWVAAGCPPDPIRGFIPNPTGEGGSLRLMEHQNFSSDGVIVWDEPGAAKPVGQP